MFQMKVFSGQCVVLIKGKWLVFLKRGDDKKPKTAREGFKFT